jgi:DNA-binding PadR family transcriptional regulator
MELKGLVSAEWKLSPTKRRARYYKLTSAGRKQLGVEQSSFARLVDAISSVMQPEHQE